MKIKSTLLALAAFSAFGVVSSQGATLAAYTFPATNSLTATTVANDLTVSNFTVSAGTISTNQTAGTDFPNEPFVQGNAGWTSTTQAAAKNFFFTITANPGFTFSLENITFNGLASSAGPSAIGLAVGTTNITSVNAGSGALVAFNSPITGQTGLTTATIRIQGWDNGSRTTSGGGDFRIDDLVVSGTVVPEPSTALLGSLGALALLRRRR